MYLCDLGAENLSAAIVKQAVIDWCCAKEYLIYGSAPLGSWGGKMPAPLLVLREIEKFFLGDWFVTISDLRGPVLLKALQNGPLVCVRGNGVYVQPERAARRITTWAKVTDQELRDELLRSGYDQKSVARAIGIHDATLCGWLRSGLTEERAERIRRAVRRLKARRED